MHKGCSFDVSLISAGAWAHQSTAMLLLFDVFCSAKQGVMCVMDACGDGFMRFEEGNRRQDQKNQFLRSIQRLLSRTPNDGHVGQLPHQLFRGVFLKN